MVGVFRTLLFGLMFGIIDARINCIDSKCSACSVGILYGSDMCVDRCPIPNSPGTKPCYRYRAYLFDMKFFTPTSYLSSSFNGFNTPGNIPFDSESMLAPIPTLNQGFYFTPTSSISKITSNAASPDFSARVSGIFKEDGTVFELMCDGISNFKMSVDVGFIRADIKLLNVNGTHYKSTQIEFNSTYWDSIIVYVSHLLGNIISITISSIYIQPPSQFFTDLEYRSCMNDTELIFGSKNGKSFRGFLLESSFLSGGPYVSSFTFRESCLCDFNQYCNLNSECTDCNSTSDTWPWCIRDT